MLMLLADGRYEGKTVLDSATVRDMETPQMLIQASSGVGREIRAWLPGSVFYTYGLGLFIQTYAGHTLVWHAGDIDGMASAVALVPDAQLGVVVLSNMNQSDARFGIVQRVLNAYLGLPPGNLSDTLLAMTQRAQKAGEAAAEKVASTRDSTGPLSHPLSNYAGVYEDPFAGAVRVSMEDGHLVLRLGNLDFIGDLEYWHDNTFRVTWRYHYYGTQYVTFDLDDLGQPARLSMGRGPVHFERVRARADGKDGRGGAGG
jgi:hypothetical protein